MNTPRQGAAYLFTCRRDYAAIYRSVFQKDPNVRPDGRTRRSSGCFVCEAGGEALSGAGGGRGACVRLWHRWRVRWREASVSLYGAAGAAGGSAVSLDADGGVPEKISVCGLCVLRRTVRSTCGGPAVRPAYKDLCGKTAEYAPAGGPADPRPGPRGLLLHGLLLRKAV